MNMSYYRLKPPITFVGDAVPYSEQTQLTIWVNHVKAGELTIPKADVCAFVRALAGDDDALRSFDDLDRHGNRTLRWECYDEQLELNTVLVSDRGQTFDVAHLGIPKHKLKEWGVL